MLADLPLMVVCGTRPEAVKLLSVLDALQRRGKKTLLVSTRQHAHLAPRMFAELGLTPDIELPPVPAGTDPVATLGHMITHLSPVMKASRPAMILVQGDTVSTLAGALAGAYAGIPVAHVEAGLRTGVAAEPFPEEMQRCLIAPIASLHLAPTERAAHALLREGVSADNIRVTGNSGIDSLYRSRARLDADQALQQHMQAQFPFCASGRRPVILATVHRRENAGSRLRQIASALARLAAEDDIDIILPLHPNPAASQTFKEELADLRRVHLVPPLDHAEIIWVMQRASLLLTDSGGLQEEAPSFGLRTLVLRQVTERMEAVEAGVAELSTFRPMDIVRAARRLLSMPKLDPCHPFGDGQAGERIAEHVLSWLGFKGTATAPPLRPEIASATENPESWLRSGSGHPA